MITWPSTEPDLRNSTNINHVWKLPRNRGLERRFTLLGRDSRLGRRGLQGEIEEQSKPLLTSWTDLEILFSAVPVLDIQTDNWGPPRRRTVELFLSVWWVVIRFHAISNPGFYELPSDMFVTQVSVVVLSKFRLSVRAQSRRWEWESRCTILLTPSRM